LWPGQRPEVAERGEHRGAHTIVVGVRAVRRDECRQEPRGDAGDGAREVLADAREAAVRQLILGPPEEVDLVGHPVDFAASGHLLPERGQDDVGLRKEQCKADLVDPFRCLRHRANHGL
jgi:hypothetical protein